MALIPAHIPQAIEVLEPAVDEFIDLGDSEELAMIEHQLARAHWLSNRNEPALVYADRALGRAERIDSTALIADILITKGSLVQASGRGHEGVALLRAGKELAEANELTATVTRGLLNLSASGNGIDPRQSYLDAREAVQLARRYGLRTTLYTAGGNAIESAVSVGEWAWAAAEAERLMTEDIEAVDRFVVYRGAEELRAFRGEPVEQMLAEHAHFISGDENPVNQSNYSAAKAAYEFSTGLYRPAADNWERSAQLNFTNAPSDLPRAVRAALWMSDVALAQRLIGEYEALHVFGAFPSAWRATYAAGVAALQGRRDEALALFADAQLKWPAASVIFEGALIGIDMLLTLDADEPAARMAAETSRATLAELGAKPFVELIDRLLAKPAADFI